MQNIQTINGLEAKGDSLIEQYTEMWGKQTLEEFGTNFSSDITDFIGNKKANFFVSTHNGKVNGGVSLVPAINASLPCFEAKEESGIKGLYDLESLKTGEFTAIVVGKSYRGVGLASNIRKFAYEFANQQNYDVLFGELMGRNKISHPRFCLENEYKNLIIDEPMKTASGNVSYMTFVFMNDKTSDRLMNILREKYRVSEPAEFMEKHSKDFLEK